MDLRPPPHPSYLSSLKSWLDDLYIFLQSLFRYDRQVSPYEVDHGAAGQGFSLYDILTNIGTTTKATVVFKRAGTYTVSSWLNASSYTNVYFQFEPGAILSVADLGTWSSSSGLTWNQLSSSLATGIWTDVLNTLILPSPGHIIASPTQQIFSGSGVVAFGSTDGVVYPEWIGGTPDGTTDSTAALRWALATHCKVLLHEGSSYWSITDNIADSTFTGALHLEGIGMPEIRHTLTPYGTATENSGIRVGTDATDVTILNVYLRGNYTGAGTESGIGINLAQISGHAKIDNVRSSHWNQYGFYAWDIYAEIGYLECHNNRSQGVAIVNNSKLIVFNYIKTYSNGSSGFSTEWSTRAIGLKNIIVHNIESYSNDSYGVVITTGTSTNTDFTGQSLTADDFSNIVLGTVIARSNGQGGVYLRIPDVTIDNILSHNNTGHGVVVDNQHHTWSKNIILGYVESRDNTQSGVYLSPSSTTSTKLINIDAVYSYDNGEYGLRVPTAATLQADLIRIGYHYLDNNTSGNANHTQLFLATPIHIGFGTGVSQHQKVRQYHEIRKALSNNGSTNDVIRLPIGARIIAIHVQIDTIDGGASAEYRIQVSIGGVTTLGDIDVSAAGATGYRVFRPEDNYLDASDDDTANMGWQVAVAAGDSILADPVGTWTGGNAVGTIAVEFAW